VTTFDKQRTLAQISRFDEILDVRSPAEYAEDHIPQAANFPVLDDDERAEVGTVYKQVSPFEARKRGAAKVAANIARHLQQHWQGRERDWRPLVYCWRGGTRSAAMVHVLNNIGWRAQQLPGGYKAYRRAVIAAIAGRSAALDFRVLCGRTGVGKSRLLEVLREHGEQALDLEGLAVHRGSVLGEVAGGEQPPQRWFESLLCREMRALDPALPVYVEAESRRIGKVHVPTPLTDAIRAGRCIRIEASLDLRVPFLVSEYRHFLDDPRLLEQTLSRLAEHAGEARIREWLRRRDAGDITGLVRGLLEQHYDPLYLRSMKRHFAHYGEAARVELRGIDRRAFADAARAVARATADSGRGPWPPHQAAAAVAARPNQADPKAQHDAAADQHNKHPHTPQ